MKKRKSNKRFRRIIVYIVLFAIFILLGRGIYLKVIEDTENSLVVNENNEQKEEIESSISIGVIGFDTFNPILTKNEDIVEFTPLIYNSLFIYDKEMKLKNDLIEEYNYNDNKLCMRIKKDILWHDGTSLTTKDIEFTINMINDNNSIYKPLLNDIESIEIIDQYNFNLVLKDGTNRVAHTKLTFPIISYIYYERESFTTSYKNLIPMGTGMFRYSDKLSDTEYVFRLNAYYNGPKPKFNEISVMTFTTLGQAISAIKSKKVDLINTSISNYEEYLGTIGYGKTEYISNSFVCLGINKENVNLANVNIRKALNVGINKQSIIDTVFNKFGIVSQSLVYPDSYLYNNTNENNDINNAKQYLANSNIKEKITLRLLIDDSDENNILVANMLKENIENIGISILIEEKDKTEYLNKLSNKNYDLVLVNFDISNYTEFSMFTKDKYYGIFDLSNYEQYNSLVNSMAYDEVNLKQTYEGIQKYINEYIPYIGIGFKKSTLIYNNNLIGVSNPRFRNIYININEIYKKK